jgi:hypothetical protein
MSWESDTDLQKRLGLTYERLTAAAHAPVPEPVFDTAHVRTNQRETIRILTEENTRLLRANGELSRQVAALQSRVGLPQDGKGGVTTPPTPSNAVLGPATQQGFTENRDTCADCGAFLWRDGLCPECGP